MRISRSSAAQSIFGITNRLVWLAGALAEVCVASLPAFEQPQPPLQLIDESPDGAAQGSLA
jgi:hypothetical protein